MLMTADEQQTACRLPLSITAADCWCQAIAYTPTDGRTFQPGHHLASTPRLAMRWLHGRARDIADQLDPIAARPARHWIHDHAENERALATLTQGEPYSFALTEDTTRYILSAHPTGSPR